MTAGPLSLRTMKCNKMVDFVVFLAFCLQSMIQNSLCVAEGDWDQINYFYFKSLYFLLHQSWLLFAKNKAPVLSNLSAVLRSIPLL